MKKLAKITLALATVTAVLVGCDMSSRNRIVEFAGDEYSVQNELKLYKIVRESPIYKKIYNVEKINSTLVVDADVSETKCGQKEENVSIWLSRFNSKKEENIVNDVEYITFNIINNNSNRKNSYSTIRNSIDIYTHNDSNNSFVSIWNNQKIHSLGVDFLDSGASNIDLRGDVFILLGDSAVKAYLTIGKNNPYGGTPIYVIYQSDTGKYYIDYSYRYEGIESNTGLLCALDIAEYIDKKFQASKIELR